MVWNTYLDSVEFLYLWMGISDGSAIVGNNVRNFVGSHSFPDDPAEFELGFLLINPVSLIPSLGI